MHLLHHHVPSSASCVRCTTALTFSVRWYKRHETQKRFTAFFASTGLASAFGGLFAYAVSKLDGKAGLSSWRWIFVIGTPSTLLCGRALN